MVFSPRGFLLLASLVAVIAHGVRLVRVGRRVGHDRADALPLPSSLISVREVVSEAVGAPDKDDEPVQARVQAAPVHKSGATEENDDETSSATSSSSSPPSSSPRSRADSGSSSSSSNDDDDDSAESDGEKPPSKGVLNKGGLSNEKGSTSTSTTSRASKSRPGGGRKSTSSRSGEEKGSTDVGGSSGMEASVRSGSDHGGDGGNGEGEEHVDGVDNILDSLDPEIAKFLATGRKRERKAELENMSESELQVSDDTACIVSLPVVCSPLCTCPCVCTRPARP